jgi:hypothetical protein
VILAYRELDPKTGIPVIFLSHPAAVLDNWIRRVVDGIAEKHRVEVFDNRARRFHRFGTFSGSVQSLSIQAITLFIV